MVAWLLTHFLYFIKVLTNTNLLKTSSEEAFSIWTFKSLFSIWIFFNLHFSIPFLFGHCNPFPIWTFLFFSLFNLIFLFIQFQSDFGFPANFVLWYEQSRNIFWIGCKVRHPKYYTQLKTGAHQSHLARQKMGWFLAD